MASTLITIERVGTSWALRKTTRLGGSFYATSVDAASFLPNWQRVAPREPREAAMALCRYLSGTSRAVLSRMSAEDLNEQVVCDLLRIMGASPSRVATEYPDRAAQPASETLTPHEYDGADHAGLIRAEYGYRPSHAERGTLADVSTSHGYHIRAGRGTDSRNDVRPSRGYIGKMRVAEAARLAGITDRHLRRVADAGEIPYEWDLSATKPERLFARPEVVRYAIRRILATYLATYSLDELRALADIID